MSDALSMMSEAISNPQTTAKVRKLGGSVRSIYTEKDGPIHQVTFPETSESTDEMIHQLHNKLSGNQVSFQDTKVKDLEEKVESLSQSINNMLKSNYPQSPLRPYPSRGFGFSPDKRYYDSPNQNQDRYYNSPNQNQDRVNNYQKYPPSPN